MHEASRIATKVRSTLWNRRARLFFVPLRPDSPVNGTPEDELRPHERGKVQEPFDKQKGARRRLSCADARNQGSVRMACARRDFVREARFLCTIFLSAMRSITA